MLSEQPQQHGVRRRCGIACGDPEPPALPVLDRGIVIKQQREHEGVIAFRVGQ
ncbi:hypothetical protein [Paraburkholderia sp. BR14320]|uniref:hypothetical protein n=1 Tax=unclassified Paraburkholderia TaxID=2615204 RepID=UPI0034CD6BC7